MVEIVTSENEISLGNTRFPIRGRVQPSLISTFPGKVVIGDYTYDDEQIASNWIISDQRGGILVEEMDESIHFDRCWWSTCNLGFKGHIVLPPLATEITKLPSWVSPTGFVDPDTQWTDEANAYDDNTATYAHDTTVSPNVWTSFLELSIASTEINAIRYYASTSGVVTKIDVDLYYNSQWNHLYEDTIYTDQWVTIELAAALSVTSARVRIYATGEGEGRLNEFDFLKTSAGSNVTPLVWENYNSRLYVARDDILYKLNQEGNLFIPIKTVDANITALVSSVGGNLYIFQGDSNNYYMMTTAEAFTQKNKAATLSIHWDNKLFGMDSAGQLFYSSDPNVATPTWTNNGNLADEGIADGDVKTLHIYRDADAEPIIYAGTVEGLFAHDYTNAKFLQTELSLPNHPNCTRGIVVWRDSLFVSAGLDVFRYIAARTATISFEGLATEDELPASYDGEVVKFIKGYNEFFALVDASEATGTGYSSVMAYDGVGWQCKWLAADADKVMNSGIVSSVFAHRLWFDHDDKIYYITLQRSLRNPHKVSGYTFGSSGVHITPWFDAGTPYDKLALRAKCDCDGMSANETVIVKYRLNHSNTDIDTGWTTLGTITSDGETEYTFGSSLGTVFRAIQFRFDLASGTNTLTPDIFKFNLAYLKLLPAKWGWSILVDCSDEYGGNTSAQLISALNTLIEAQTLAEFTYRDESGGSFTYYAKVASATALEETGHQFRGQYQISLVEP